MNTEPVVSDSVLMWGCAKNSKNTKAPVAASRISLPGSASLSRGLLIAWFCLSSMIAIAQAYRIVRFRRRLRGALPAPDTLVDEAYRICGQRVEYSLSEAEAS